MTWVVQQEMDKLIAKRFLHEQPAVDGSAVSNELRKMIHDLNHLRQHKPLNGLAAGEDYDENRT